MNEYLREELEGEHVGRHPVLRRHPELAAICDRAAEALADLYQAVGRITPPPDSP